MGRGSFPSSLEPPGRGIVLETLAAPSLDAGVLPSYQIRASVASALILRLHAQQGTRDEGHG